METPLLSIGEIADRTGVSRRTVRYYVQRGLIDAPLGRGRGSGYSQAHVEQIERVLRLQREGVTLDTIEQLPEGEDIAAAPQEAAAPIIVLRIELQPGVRLEIDAAAGMPRKEVMDELAAACRAVLEKSVDEEEAGEAKGGTTV